METFAVFGIIVFLLFSTDVACDEDPCRQLDFRAALSFRGQKLTNHVIRTIDSVINDFCGAECFMENNCVSYNIISSESPSITKCELNNSTHNEHPDDLKPCPNCIYRGAKNACGKRPCKNNAICQAGFTNKGYRCVCVPGFKGEDCMEDVDECATAEHKCPANAVCTNTHGSYNCTCMVGYTGDGINCTDIDECAAQVDPCDGITSSVCNNTYGSYNCLCGNGFVNNGLNCEDIDECSAEGSHKCDVNATCTNNPGSYDCSCQAGYTGDGLNCTDIDECASSNACVNGGANCTNTEGSYSCICQPGYVWDGTNCQVDVCHELNYQTLIDTQRDVSFSSVHPYQCDGASPLQWYRFLAITGVRMATTCPASYTCDTVNPGWLQYPHPTVDQGIEDSKVCFHYAGNCCGRSKYIKVKNCGSYYVYRFDAAPLCDMRYCYEQYNP